MKSLKEAINKNELEQFISEREKEKPANKARLEKTLDSVQGFAKEEINSGNIFSGLEREL